MQCAVFTRIGSVALVAALITATLSCGPAEELPEYTGRWICPSNAKKFFEIKPNATAFLVTNEKGETYAASLDPNNTLVLSGVPSVGTLHLPLDLETDELICSTCRCKRYVRDVESAEAAMLKPKEEYGDLEKQRQTITDIKNIGTAMMSWLTDQVGAGAAGAGQRRGIAEFPAISVGDLEALIVPTYSKEIPEKDGWGHPYEYYLQTQDPFAARIMIIRSPGRDGRFSDDVYEVGSFGREDFDEDIVWSDGFFVRWPSGVH